MAQELSAQGIEPGDRVLVRAPNDLQAIVALALWALRAVGGVLPSASAWPSLPPIRWLLSTDVVEGFDAETILIDDEFFAAAVARSEPLELEAYESEDSPCRLLFSSGTTGSPVAIELSVGALEGRCTFIEKHWMPARPYFSLIPLAGTFGVYALNNAMATESTYLVPGTPKENLEMITSEYVACTVGSVAQIEALCAEAESAGGGLEDLAVIYPTGTSMPPSLDRLLRELSSAQIESAYGATELGPISTGTFGPDGVLRFSPPADHVVSQVVDAAQQPLASGQQGVLRLRTATMVNDYVGASGRGHAFQDGWFYPGDLATFAQDGSFVLIGRTTEVANIDGVKDDPTLASRKQPSSSSKARRASRPSWRWCAMTTRRRWLRWMPLALRRMACGLRLSGESPPSLEPNRARCSAPIWPIGGRQSTGRPSRVTGSGEEPRSTHTSGVLVGPQFTPG
jgi:acyl-coenzyme A synthetase/AMP-(fatty) acid ligase